MREGLVIAVAQPRCVSFDVAANALIHAATFAPRAPVWWSFPSSRSRATSWMPTIDAGDPRFAPIVAACAETGSLALVGAPVAGEAGRRHIAVLAVDGGGASVAYRKIWLGGAEPIGSPQATGPPSSRSTDGDWVWRSARTPGCRNTPPTPPRSGSTPTSPAPANQPRTRRDRTNEHVASPPITTSGSRSRASPARLAAGMPRRPAVRGSGRRTVRSSSRPARCRRGGPHDAHLTGRLSRSPHPAPPGSWYLAPLPLRRAGVAEWQTQRT